LDEDGEWSQEEDHAAELAGTPVNREG
jgi:hypothetical protein